MDFTIEKAIHVERVEINFTALHSAPKPVRLDFNNRTNDFRLRRIRVYVYDATGRILPEREAHDEFTVQVHRKGNGATTWFATDIDLFSLPEIINEFVDITGQVDQYIIEAGTQYDIEVKWTNFVSVTNHTVPVKVVIELIGQYGTDK